MKRFRLGLFVFVLFCYIVEIGGLKCSETEFCSYLRDRPTADIYTVDINSIQIDDMGIIKFNILARIGYEDLEVYIYAYKDDILRVKIKEFNSTRFELSDVFAGAPNLAGVSSVDTEAIQMTITTNIGSRVVVKFAPFSLDFYRNEILELVLNGERLFVDNPQNSQSFSVGLSFPRSDHLYGLHEHATGLILRRTENDDPYRMYNLDHAEYPINDTASVYGAVPFIYGHGPEVTAGVFLHNAAQQFVDILPDQMAYFMAEAGTLDLFVFLGPTPAEILRQYLLITGVSYMPPLWSLGYHQSRYSYLTQEEVKDVVANFDNYNFQLDAIWLDIDHTDGQRYFTWNPDTFSDPIEMQNNISATNRKLVAISDPHIKVEKGYSVYDGALENEFFVKNSDGSVFEGRCYPGASSYIDFLNPEARNYYGGRYSYENFPGTTSTLAGIWNDMNEPVVFDLPEYTIPGDSLHFRNVRHMEMHNAYGMLHSRATFEGMMQRDNRTVRPFVLSRSHFAGSQRYAAIWTGDSRSTWEYLDISYAICLNSNLVGIVFCGGDVGGYAGDPDTELYQRWYQAGAWLPFFRAHSGKATPKREPYLFPEDVQNVIRNAIQQRYKHLPVWYTLFHEYIVYKTPLIRPLFFHYTNDRNVFETQNQILVGKFWTGRNGKKVKICL
jgi:alpha 1,3-glucosidase